MCGLTDISCHAREAAQSALEELGQKIVEAVGAMIKGSLTWWVDTPSLDPDATHAAHAIRQWVLPITLAIAVGGLMWQGVRMAWLRRADPMLDVSRGLITLIVVTSVTFALPTLLLNAGDRWSTWVLNRATDGHFQARMMSLVGLDTGSALQLGIAILLGIIAFIAALVQWVLLYLREAGLVVLIGMAQLAASGAFARTTSGWVNRTIAWLLAVITWKPLAALVYATGFVLVDGHSLASVVLGLTVIVLAIFVLPLLIKIFDVVGANSGGGGGLGGILAAAGTSAMALRASGPVAAGAAMTAGGYAQMMANNLGGASGGAGPAGPGGGGPTGSGGPGTATPGGPGTGGPGGGPNTPPTGPPTAPSGSETSAGDSAPTTPVSSPGSGPAAGAATGTGGSAGSGPGTTQDSSGASAIDSAGGPGSALAAGVGSGSGAGSGGGASGPPGGRSGLAGRPSSPLPLGPLGPAAPPRGVPMVAGVAVATRALNDTTQAATDAVGGDLSGGPSGAVGS